MSHRVDMALALKDRAALRRACKALMIDFTEGKHVVDLFAGQKAEADASFLLPGWRYRVAVNLKAGTAAFDNYGGHWGKQEDLDKFVQEYTLQVAEHEAGVQELIMCGWTPSRIQHSNGMAYDILGLPEGVAPVTPPQWREKFQRVSRNHRCGAITSTEFLTPIVARFAVSAAPVIWDLAGLHLRWIKARTPLWAAAERKAEPFQGYPVYEWHRSAGWSDSAGAWMFSLSKAQVPKENNGVDTRALRAGVTIRRRPIWLILAILVLGLTALTLLYDIAAAFHQTALHQTLQRFLPFYSRLERPFVGLLLLLPLVLVLLAIWQLWPKVVSTPKIHGPVVAPTQVPRGLLARVTATVLGPFLPKSLRNRLAGRSSELPSPSKPAADQAPAVDRAGIGVPGLLELLRSVRSPPKNSQPARRTGRAP